MTWASMIGASHRAVNILRMDTNMDTLFDGSTGSESR
jgi:hypothetical protein